MEKTRISIQMHRPEVNELMFFLLSGAIVSVPLTIFIDQYLAVPLLTGLSSVDIGVISVAVVAPFVEEFSKVFPLGYRHGETQRSIFSLAVCVGLGFGIVEFITYVATFGPQIIPARIPGLFFHPASTSITAYGLATKRPLPFYFAAVGLHFANNFLAVFAPMVAPASVIVLAITLLASWNLHKKTKEVFIQTDNVCTC
jgi:RsiW-degrading membrane proteinase PrsW (M82 family)